MSISEDVRPAGDGPDDEPHPRPPRQQHEPSAADFERTPPQDVAAEQCVLGGMLLSKDAIADVVEILKTNDFYQPKHGIVFDAILDLYGRGEPADLITVASALVDSGDIGRVGGAGYLHTLVSAVPTAANAAYYARIVADRAMLRRLIEAGTRVTQLGYGAAAGAGRDIDDVIDMAQQAVYDVTERRVSEDFAPLNELLQPTLDEIEAIGANGGVMTGVPTGFTDLDNLLNGLHPGQLIIVAGRPGLGKALALDTPLPTPDGWTTMGEVQVGDRLIGADGRPTRVVAATEVMQDRPCYEVEFSDGTVIVADAQHQWRTSTRASRRQRSEGNRSLRWSMEGMHRLRQARAAAEQGPDQWVALSAVTADFGAEFRHVLHTVAGAVGSAGSVTRTYQRGGRSWSRAVPAYSRQAVLSALHDRAVGPIDDGQTVRHREVVTTEEIAASVRCPDGRPNHAIAVAGPAELPERELPIPAYTLGIWLGDGDSAGNRYTSADPEIAEYVRDEGMQVTALGGLRYSIKLPAPAAIPNRSCAVCGREFRPKASNVRTCGRSCGGRARFVSAAEPEPNCPDCGGPATGAGAGRRQCRDCRARSGSFTARLRSLGVYDDKHIPRDYLRASERQRRALLAGLLDSDGYAMPSGTVQFAVTCRRLAYDVRELVLSLGYQVSMSTKRVDGRREASSICYMLTFTPAEPVFRLRRKLVRQRGATRVTTRRRYVVDVRPVASVPVRCVQVDSADHMYLASESWIPTHNSTVAMDFARACSIKNNMASVIFSLEMSKVEIVMRLLSAEARVPLHTLRSGQLSDDDWTKLARRMGEISEAPLFCDDTPNMNLMEVRSKARRLKQRHDIKLIVVDYLQLMSGPKRAESRQQEVAELSRGLKLLAKEVDCPVIAACQLNRGPEQRTDKRPQLSDLRESGSIEQDADVVLLLHREDYYDKETPRAGEADFIVAKHRNGPTDTITVAAQLHLSRFVDMAVS
ncbi:replicative DNA helicase [Actinocatenispora sera]|uniref:replicative DNA helicase n=1 Tax=Actinocatenispora sera TaxID=390989 RepID=UPI0033E27DD5